eukprot:3599570-Rhodomonas_salina.1
MTSGAFIGCRARPGSRFVDFTTGGCTRKRVTGAEPENRRVRTARFTRTLVDCTTVAHLWPRASRVRGYSVLTDAHATFKLPSHAMPLLRGDHVATGSNGPRYSGTGTCTHPTQKLCCGNKDAIFGDRRRLRSIAAGLSTRVSKKALFAT